MAEVALPEWAKCLFDESARYICARGGRGSGKSRSVASALVLRAANKPLRILCGREVQKSIRDSVKRLLDDEIARCGLSEFFTSTDSEIRGKNGSLFIFAGLRGNPDSIKSMEGVDIAWIEEAATVSQNSLNILVPTIRKPGSQLIFTWNPRKETDPVDAMFCGDTMPPRSVLKLVNHSDNPWFPDELRQEMEYDKKRDYDKYLHVWEGQYQKNSEARVFKNWTVFDYETPANAVFRFGADWGYSIDPTTLVRCWIGRLENDRAIPDPQGRHLFVDFEAWEIGCEIDKTPLLFESVPESSNWPIVADSSRPETISYLRRNGYSKIAPAIKGARSVEEGVEFIRAYDVVVHPRCKHVIDELTNYSFAIDDLTGAPTNTLADKNNHCLVAGTIVRTQRGDVPIEDVVIGDYAATPNGFKLITFSGKTGWDKELVQVETTAGSFVCTPDHPVWTNNRGFVRADALRYNDEVSSFGDMQCGLRLLDSTGTITGAIQKAKASLQNVITSARLMANRMLCMLRFGRK